MVKSFYKYEGDKMTTFIFGHKSPDTDTVCSSIALSYLKNELGDKTVPKVLGNINNETRFVLNYFNVPVPSYLNDVKVRIKNVKYDKKAFIEEKIKDGSLTTDTVLSADMFDWETRVEDGEIPVFPARLKVG